MAESEKENNYENYSESFYSEDTLVENSSNYQKIIEFKEIDLKIVNWNSFGGIEKIHQFDDDDVWEFTLTKNSENLEIELNSIEKAYTYLKEYKLIFIVYDLSDIDNIEVTEGYTFYNDITEYFKIPKFFISSVIDNNSFGLKIDFTYKIINTYSFIKEIKYLINDKYRYKDEDTLEENYFEFTINGNIQERTIRNNKITKIKSKKFNIGGYEWYIQFQRDKNNENIVSLVCAEEFCDYIITNFVFIIRNKNIKNDEKDDQTIIHYRNSYNEDEIIKYSSITEFVEFSKNNRSYVVNNFLNKSDIKDLLIKNATIGIYLRIYSSSNSADKERDICIDSLEKKITDNNDEYEIFGEGYQEWKINNWSNINIDDNNENNTSIINLNNSDFIIKDKKWHFTLKNIENDYTVINLNYNKENYEDIYANFVIGLCKYANYESIETIKPKISNEYIHFTKNEFEYGFEFNKKKIEELVDDYDRINVIVYIRMYRKKNEEGKGEPEFRINKQKIKRILTEHETLKLKNNDLVIIDEIENMNNNPEFSVGYKIGRPHKMGLIPTSLYHDIN